MSWHEIDVRSPVVIARDAWPCVWNTFTVENQRASVQTQGRIARGSGCIPPRLHQRSARLFFFSFFFFPLSRARPFTRKTRAPCAVTLTIYNNYSSPARYYCRINMIILIILVSYYCHRLISSLLLLLIIISLLLLLLSLMIVYIFCVSRLVATCDL